MLHEKDNGFFVIEPQIADDLDCYSEVSDFCNAAEDLLKTSKNLDFIFRDIFTVEELEEF